MKHLIRTKWTDLAVVLAGAALPWSFAPYQFPALAVACLAVLFFGWLGVTPRRALCRGALFGVGMFGMGVSWVHISIHEFGGVPVALSVLLTGLLIAYLTLYPALLGYVLARFFGGMSVAAARVNLLWVMPAGWVLAELVRGWFMTGFPWLNLGYSQIETPLRGYAPLFGVYGVSWAVAVLAGTVVALLLARSLRERLAYGALAVVIAVVGALLSERAWTTPAGDPITATLLQGNMSQDIKWQEELREPTIELYTKLTRDNWDSKLIVWPETALPDFYHRQEPFVDELAAEARSHGADILMGVLYLDLTDRRYYNTMISVGTERDFYHKRHLVPFTEYLPFKSVLGSIVDFMAVPMSDFSRGAADKNTLRAAGHAIAMSICFEDVFGEETRLAMPEATMLVNVSNDAWFGTSAAPHQHLQIARMRALEVGRPLLRATNTGVTAMVDDQGRFIAVAPQFEVAALRGTVQPRSGMTPYAAAGNYPLWTAAFAVLVIAWWRRRVTRTVVKENEVPQ